MLLLRFAKVKWSEITSVNTQTSHVVYTCAVKWNFTSEWFYFGQKDRSENSLRREKSGNQRVTQIRWSEENFYNVISNFWLEKLIFIVLSSQICLSSLSSWVLCFRNTKISTFIFTRSEGEVKAKWKIAEVKWSVTGSKFHFGLRFHSGVSFTLPLCNQPLRHFLKIRPFLRKSFNLFWKILQRKFGAH